jgi:YidC/Oxa1 family membrane protein insertase
MYMGPIDFDVLKSLGRGLEKNVDLGHKYFRPVSGAVLWSLLKLHKVIPNYGLVIIVLSIFTKVLFYRLTHKSFKSMRDMQALQPRLQALKEKYKNDRQKISQETMKLYKEAGVNPLGGCLPMLLQMPVFIALFNVLRNTIELRQAPFVGWINDLSQQDVLFRLPVALPILGSAVSVLPIAMGASMLLQSRIGGSIAGPESSAAQSKMLQYMLPIVFTVLFYSMPSGLVIYWIVNTVLSVGQQYYINKGAAKAEKEKATNAEQPGEAPVKPAKRGGKKQKLDA